MIFTFSEGIARAKEVAVGVDFQFLVLRKDCIQPAGMVEVGVA
jgi:hypothetical protein